MVLCSPRNCGPISATGFLKQDSIGPSSGVVFLLQRALEHRNWAKRIKRPRKEPGFVVAVRKATRNMEETGRAQPAAHIAATVETDFFVRRLISHGGFSRGLVRVVSRESKSARPFSLPG